MERPSREEHVRSLETFHALACELRAWALSRRTRRRVEQIARAQEALSLRAERFREERSANEAGAALAQLESACRAAGADPSGDLEVLEDWLMLMRDEFGADIQLVQEALSAAGLSEERRALFRRRVFDATYAFREDAPVWIVEAFRALGERAQAALLSAGLPARDPDYDPVIATRRAADLDLEAAHILRLESGLRVCASDLRATLDHSLKREASGNAPLACWAWHDLAVLLLRAELNQLDEHVLATLSDVILECPTLMDAFLRTCLGAPLLGEVPSRQDFWTWKTAPWLREPARRGALQGPLAEVFQRIGNTARKGLFNAERRALLVEVERQQDEDRVTRGLAKFLCSVARRLPNEHLDLLGRVVVRRLGARLWQLPEHIVAWERAEFDAQAATSLPESEQPPANAGTSPGHPTGAPEPLAPYEAESTEFTEAIEELVPEPVEIPENDTADARPADARPLHLLYQEKLGTGQAVPYPTTVGELERTLEEILDRHDLEVTIPLPSIARAIAWHVLDRPAAHKHTCPKERIGDQIWDKLKRGRMRLYLRETEAGTQFHLQQRRDWTHPNQAGGI